MSGLDITLRQVLIVNNVCFQHKLRSSQLLNSLIKMLDWWSEETSTFNFSDFKFETLSELALSVLLNYLVKLEVCVFCCFLHRGEIDEVFFSIHIKNKQIWTLDAVHTTEPNKEIYNHAPVLPKVIAHETILCEFPPLTRRLIVERLLEPYPVTRSVDKPDIG